MLCAHEKVMLLPLEVLDVFLSLSLIITGRVDWSRWFRALYQVFVMEVEY